jgi:hypothetical protein
MIKVNNVKKKNKARSFPERAPKTSWGIKNRKFHLDD